MNSNQPYHPIGQSPHRPVDSQRRHPHPLYPPVLTLQRPSYPFHSSLPSIGHIDPEKKLGTRSLSYQLPTRRPSSASTPAIPSGLRKPIESGGSLSPIFDLAKYSMAIGDTKLPAHRPEARSPKADFALPPLRLASPTSPSVAHSEYNPIRRSSLKRYRDEDDFCYPYSPSASSSQTVVTPCAESWEPPLKRRSSNLDSLLSPDIDVKPFSQSWSDWNRRPSISSLLSKASPKMDNIQSVAYQFSFPDASTSIPNADPSPSANLHTDPLLSSVRSSADQIGTSGTNTPHIPPELRFTDETLASATSSPGVAVLEAALHHAHAADPSEINDSSDHLELPEGAEGSKREQPFSRSPELRISHKLAERKRRKEMKDLFDELRDLLPAERGSKSSKWEILSKAIDYMTRIKSENEELKRELANYKRDDQAAYRNWTQQPFTTVPVAMPEMLGVAANNLPSVNLASPSHAIPSQEQSIPQQPLNSGALSNSLGETSTRT